MADKSLVAQNPLVVKVAERLHYIDYFYKQLPVEEDWLRLPSAERNKYLNYTLQLLRVWEQGGTQ